MTTQIGSIVEINQRRYRVGRSGDVRKGDRIVVGYNTFTDRWGNIHFDTCVFCPSDMTQTKLRRYYQPALGTITSIRKAGRSGMIASITGIPCDVFIRYQGRCLHEVEATFDDVDEMTKAGA